MEITLPPDFKEFLKLFNCHGCKYLLIGGYAVGYHGYPRATNDPDVWIARPPENAAKIVTALQEFGFTTPALSGELFLQEKNKEYRSHGSSPNAYRNPDFNIGDRF